MTVKIGIPLLSILFLLAFTTPFFHYHHHQNDKHASYKHDCYKHDCYKHDRNKSDCLLSHFKHISNGTILVPESLPTNLVVISVFVEQVNSFSSQLKYKATAERAPPIYFLA